MTDWMIRIQRPKGATAVTEAKALEVRFESTAPPRSHRAVTENGELAFQLDSKGSDLSISNQQRSEGNAAEMHGRS